MTDKMIELVIEALQTDGAHHKQWYLEELLKLLEPTKEQLWCITWEKGIPN